jgi:predicted hydrolase (HD superfamily)
MSRDEAYKILTKYLKNKNLIKHCLAAEAAMKGIYKQLTPHDAQSPEEEAKWGITGLLHDADYELSKDQPKLHGLLLFEKEPPHAIPQEITHAIKAHNYQNTGIMPETQLDWAIATCDQLTGLIVAAALIHPEKKLAPITTDFILKRFNEKSFARGANRDSIKLCEEKLDIPLNKFIEITLESMQEIHESLGL